MPFSRSSVLMKFTNINTAGLINSDEVANWNFMTVPALKMRASVIFGAGRRSEKSQQ